MDHLVEDFSKLKYELITELELELPLIKDRNFMMIVKMIDQNGNLVINKNAFYLKIDLYSENIPPTKLTVNKYGDNIIKSISNDWNRYEYRLFYIKQQ